MEEVVRPSGVVDEDIIEKYQDEFAQVAPEQIIHEALKSEGCFA